jgi:hypothetical protein
MALGTLVVDSMVLGSVSGAARCLSGARAAESGPVAAVGTCQVLSLLLKRRAREQARLVWPGSGTGGTGCGFSGVGECCGSCERRVWCLGGWGGTVVLWLLVGELVRC